MVTSLLFSYNMIVKTMNRIVLHSHTSAWMYGWVYTCVCVRIRTGGFRSGEQVHVCENDVCKEEADHGQVRLECLHLDLATTVGGKPVNSRGQYEADEEPMRSAVVDEAGEGHVEGVDCPKHGEDHKGLVNGEVAEGHREEKRREEKRRGGRGGEGKWRDEEGGEEKRREKRHGTG